MKRSIILSICAVIGAALQAQTLQTEITLDREVEPTQREATRPAFLPQIPIEQNQQVSLDPAEYSQPGSIATNIATLPGVSWLDALAGTPYRGYASIGYFPFINLGANAGYKLVDTEKSAINAYAQFNNVQYKRSDTDMRRTNAAIGIDALVHTNDRSTLAAALSYKYGNVLRPYYSMNRNILNAGGDQFKFLDEENKSQTANGIDAKVGWSSAVGSFAYDLGLGYEYFRLGKVNGPKEFTFVPDLAESNVTFNIGLAKMRHDYKFFGMDVRGSYLSPNQEKYANFGLTAFNPYVNLRAGSFMARLGLTFYVYTGDDSGEKVSPDIRLSFAPTDKPFAAYINVISRSETTSLSKIYSISPYDNYNMTYCTLKAPIIMQAGINIGRIGGFALDIYGEFAHVKQYLMPTVVYKPSNLNATGADIPAIFQYFAPFAANSWKVGAKASYAYRDIFEIGIGVERGGSEEDELSYYQWMDGAKWHSNLYANVHATKQLCISVNFTGRTDRQLLNFIYNTDSPIYDLGNMADLCLGATYQVTSQFGAFVNLTNLLCSDYKLVSGLPSQGISGLLGITYKF